MRATIVNDGKAVQDDGLGEYVDTVQNANVNLINAGPWSNECEPFGPIVTTGSTKVQITRWGTNSYTFHAPEGSVATLSDVHDNNQQRRFTWACTM